MSSFNWESFLRQWSQAILESMSEPQRAQLPQDVLESGWLGYPGATEAQLRQTEARLGVKLPPSYRAFLKVTNGWRQTTPFIRKLWSTEEIERFAVRHQKWIEAFTNHYENSPASFEPEIALDELWEPPTVSDAEYFIYGEEQDCSKLRPEYLRTALEISDVGEAAIYLLNPQVVTRAGEWEAWFFGDWLPGADRYRSFQEMMEAEYYNFLELCDVAAGQSEPAEEPQPLESANLAVEPPLSMSQIQLIPETQNPEAVSGTEPSGTESAPAAEEKTAVWRSLKRMLIDFQARQIGERLEYRTVATSGGVQERVWMGLGERKLKQWLQEQVATEIGSAVAPTTASVAKSDQQAELQEQIATEIGSAVAPTTASVAKSAQWVGPTPIASKQSYPPLDFTLEINQLTIRQDTYPPAQITIHSTGPKQAKKNGFASLTSQQPFALEIGLRLVIPSISNLSTQLGTYQVRCHAQNRTTGQWIALGETQPNPLTSNRCAYTAYLFGNTLEPGMYRLHVLTTLRGATAGLTAFELPLLNVA